MSLAGSLAKTNTSVGKNTSKVFSNGNKKPGKLGGITDSVSGIQKNVAGTVVGVGNIVAKVSGALGFNGLANSLTGSTSIKYDNKNQESQFVSGLKGFYKQFSGISLNQVDRIDPFNTFDCEFRFFPSVAGVKNVTRIDKEVDRRSTYDDSDSLIEKSSKTTSSTSMDSVIGKLYQQVRFSNNLVRTENEKAGDKYDEYSDEAENKQLDEGFLDEETGEWVNFFEETKKTTWKEPVQIDLYVTLGMYIQKVTLPTIQIDGAEESTTLVGKFPIPGNLVVPSDNSFSMEIINTQAPVIENIFYPWMKETTLPWWSYAEQPFTTATISFDFTEHSNTKYHFFGCRPTQIMLVQPDQQANTNLTRQVTFTFDFMTIETSDASEPITYKGQEAAKNGSGKKTGDSWTNLANGALFSATNTLKL